MPELLLGIDIGTSSSKAVVVEPSGDVVATAQLRHQTSNPRPGWFEHDAESIWWGDTVALIQKILGSARVDGSDIAGIAVSAIGPCLLPLDEQGRPLRPGILYGIDTRASKQVEAISQSIGTTETHEYFGMDFTSQAIGPKMAWIKQEEPDVWSTTRRISTASSYIVFRLTGEHIIDRHTAGHHMPFFDNRQMGWTDRFADVVDGFELLPELGWAPDSAGGVTEQAARVTGLRAGTSVAVGTVDAAAEGLSVGVHRPGDLMVMYGSTMFFILVSNQRLAISGGWLVGGLEEGVYNVAAGMTTAGLLTEWVRELTSGIDSSPEYFGELFAAAAALPAGAEGLLMLPYFEGERTPINDPNATGVMVGLGLHHGPEHLMRAALEATAYGARQIVTAMTNTQVPVNKIVAVGGGTKDRVWMQIVSDVGGFEQLVPRQRIGASYGDAFIAGVAAGALSVADLDSWVDIESVVKPDLALGDLYESGSAHFRDLYEATRPIQHALRGLRHQRA